MYLRLSRGARSRTALVVLMRHASLFLAEGHRVFQTRDLGPLNLLEAFTSLRGAPNPLRCFTLASRRRGGATPHGSASVLRQGAAGLDSLEIRNRRRKFVETTTLGSNPSTHPKAVRAHWEDVVPTAFGRICEETADEDREDVCAPGVEPEHAPEDVRSRVL